jgi:hypothetical protein
MYHVLSSLSRGRRKNMDEKSTIKDLESQATNTKLLMDRLNQAAYGMTFDELIRYMGRRDDDAK